MSEIRALLRESLNIDFLTATLSNPKGKDGLKKVKVRPILKKDVLYFQCETYKNNQAFHENYEVEQAIEVLAEYLESRGYDAQILEFIDMEHTPKNILIRAVKTGRKKENEAAIQACEAFWHIQPTLGRLLKEREITNETKDH